MVFGLFGGTESRKGRYGYEKETLTHLGNKSSHPPSLSSCLQSNCRPLDRILIAQISSAVVYPRWRRRPRTLPRLPFGTFLRTDARDELMSARRLSSCCLHAVRAWSVATMMPPKKGRYGEGTWLAMAMSETTKSSASVDMGEGVRS